MIMSKMLKVAVTGASGFVGRNVVRELIKEDVVVIAITRDKSRLSEFADKVKIIEFDMVNMSNHVFDDLERPDVLLHLAWAGLPNYLSLHHFERELPLQYAFLKNMIQQGLKSVVVAGTCFEYGMQSGPLSVDMETRPENPYGFAKDVLRTQLEFFQEKTHFNLTWARLFYLFGDGQSENSLWPQIKKAATDGVLKFNMSGGEQLRDYLAVEDAANYLVGLTLKQKDHGVVNVCSGKPITVRVLIEQWIEEHKWEIDLNLGYYEYPDYEPMAFWGIP